jgi:hypothetical protein
MGRPCSYCDSDVAAHAAVCIRDCTEDCSLVGRFCNFACLTAYVDDNDLAVGDACEWASDDSVACC